MALKRGRMFADNVIAGRYGSKEPLDDNSLFVDVMEVLSRCHRIRDHEVTEDGVVRYGPIGVNKGSRWLQLQGAPGTLVRVTQSAGSLLIGKDDDGKFVDLYFGDWAFVPSGVFYKIVNMSVVQKLHFATAVVALK